MRKYLLLLIALFAFGWQGIAFSQPSTGIGTSYSTYRERAAKPPNPPANYQRLYYKSDHKLYTVNSSGTETEIGAGSGSVATDTIWAAAGDTVYGTGNDAAAILSKGTAYQLYMMNSGATAPAWTSTLGVTGTRLTKGWFTDLESTNMPTVGGVSLASTFFPFTGGTMTGNLIFTDNTYDIGASGATRPRTIYAGTSVVAPVGTFSGAVTAGSFSANKSSGVASTLQLYNDYLTETYGLIFKGPTGTMGSAYTLQYPNATPTTGQVSAYGTPMTWVTPLTTTTANLPTSDADPGTTAGQIRHDSSSTESQTTARGVVKWFDGTSVRTLADIGTDSTIIVKTEFLPIRYAEDGTTPPAAAAAVTGKIIIARSFATTKDVVFFWSVPADYVGAGDVKYRVHYALSADAEADDTVSFSTTDA